MPNSHNVMVELLDPDLQRAGRVALHGWPYRFYTRTVTDAPAAYPAAWGYGFPLSMEGGGWASRGSFQPNETAPVRLTGLPRFVFTLPDNIPLNTRQEINPTKLTATGGAVAPLTSGLGTLNITGDLFLFQNGGSLTPQSSGNNARVMQSLMPTSVPVLEPAWVSLGVTVTNLVNYVKFDAGFTSATGAQGLFTVYWGTNLIGTLDERVTSTALQTYRFSLPSSYSDGQYTLGFRLDAYTTTPSSLTLTNVMTGFIGITNPPALAVTASATSGPAQITLTGATGFYSLLQGSTDLTNWTSVATLVNSNGVVQFTDPGSTNQARRYYRAVVP